MGLVCADHLRLREHTHSRRGSPFTPHTLAHMPYTHPPDHCPKRMQCLALCACLLTILYVCLSSSLLTNHIPCPLSSLAASPPQGLASKIWSINSQCQTMRMPKVPQHRHQKTIQFLMCCLFVYLFVCLIVYVNVFAAFTQPTQTLPLPPFSPFILIFVFIHRHSPQHYPPVDVHIPTIQIHNTYTTIQPPSASLCFSVSLRRDGGMFNNEHNNFKQSALAPTNNNNPCLLRLFFSHSTLPSFSPLCLSRRMDEGYR